MVTREILDGNWICKKKIRIEPLAWTTFHDLGILVAFQFYNPMGEEGSAVEVFLGKNELYRIQISSILLSSLLFIQIATWSLVFPFRL